MKKLRSLLLFCAVVALVAPGVFLLTACGGETLHRVQFNMQGGTGNSTTVDQMVVDGAFAQKPTTSPIKDGYTFVDWYTAASGGTAFDFAATPIDADKILYARWEQTVTEIPAGIYETTTFMVNGISISLDDLEDGISDNLVFKSTAQEVREDIMETFESAISAEALRQFNAILLAVETELAKDLLDQDLQTNVWNKYHIVNTDIQEMFETLAVDPQDAAALDSKDTWLTTREETIAINIESEILRFILEMTNNSFAIDGNNVESTVFLGSPINDLVTVVSTYTLDAAGNVTVAEGVIKDTDSAVNLQEIMEEAGMSIRLQGNELRYSILRTIWNTDIEYSLIAIFTNVTTPE